MPSETINLPSGTTEAVDSFCLTAIRELAETGSIVTIDWGGGDYRVRVAAPSPDGCDLDESVFVGRSLCRCILDALQIAHKTALPARAISSQGGLRMGD